MPTVTTTIAPGDRRALTILLIVTVIAYAWFFHGDGWSMASHFSTIRSLVERGTFEISPFAAETGDVSTVGGRIYSNKPPGLPLLGVGPYWLISTVERLAGMDPSAARVVRLNQYALTMLLCAVPGAALVVMLYAWFRLRDGAGARTSLILAGAFALGTLAWPYAGMMFNHLLVAALTFGAWMLVSSPGVSHVRALAAGLLLGLAALSEYLAGPLVVLYLLYDLARHRRPARVALLCVGPALALGGLLWYHAALFGNPFTPSYQYDNPEFIAPDLALGKFHWPVWRRLYWLTWHRYRGLFANCPVFLLPVLALLATRWRSVRPQLETWFPLAVVAYFTLFLLTYASWAGGSGVGPRFFIPAMAFLYLFSRPAVERFPRISAIFIGFSIVNMLTITSVRALYPGNDRGVPLHFDPLGVCLVGFVRGQVAQGPGSFNLGTLVGMSGIWSVVPVIAVIVAWACVAWRWGGNEPERVVDSA